MRLIESNAIPAALFLCGPFYYYVMAHWFGIAHPAWIIGGYLMLATLAVLPQRFGLLLRSLGAIDYLLMAFLLIVLFSMVMHGPSERGRGVYLLAVSLLLPYGTVRLFTLEEVGVFIRTCAILGLAALPISFIGLWMLSPVDLEQDRIRGLFGVYYSNNEAGLVIGLCMVMCAIFVLLSDRKKHVGFAYRSIAWAGLALSAGLLTFLSARGGMVAGLGVSVILILFVKPVSARTRVLLLGVLILSVIISASMLPQSRKDFIGQLNVMNLPPISKQVPPISKQNEISNSSELPENPLKLRPQILLDGNSSAIRVLLYYDALNLIARFPFFGVGAGNFGVYSPIVKLQSENALCADKKEVRLICPQSPIFSSPHSTILHVFAELGIFGMVVFSALMFFLAKGLYIAVNKSANERIKSYAWYLGGGWLFFLILDQFYGNYFTSFQFYLWTGCVAAFLSNVAIHNYPPIPCPRRPASALP